VDGDGEDDGPGLLARLAASAAAQAVETRNPNRRRTATGHGGKAIGDAACGRVQERVPRDVV